MFPMVFGGYRNHCSAVAATTNTEKQFPVGLTNSHEKTVCDLPIATRPICEASYSVLRLSWSLADETICPLDKVLHVRCVSVTAVVLAPDELASEQALVYGRHFCRPVVA
jgi:hypothetical protein